MSPLFHRIEFDEIDSTSQYARRIVEADVPSDPIDSPLIILATAQSGGRGRMGKPWSSPRGGLWFTLIWKPARPMPALADGLGLRIGVAITEGLRAAVGEAAAAALLLKWPNDVLHNRRKVCGILTEIVGRGDRLRVLVGVGVNLNFDPAMLPDSLRERTTTLRAALGRDLDRDLVLNELALRTAAAIDAPWPDAALIDRANAMLFGTGAEYIGLLEDGTADFGVFTGLDARGIPVVQTSHGPGRLPTTAL